MAKSATSDSHASSAAGATNPAGLVNSSPESLGNTPQASQNGEQSAEQARRDTEDRVERIADALINAYLFECRQEQTVGKDDTPPDQPVVLGELDNTATEAFRDYEEQGHGGHLAHFVTYVIDGFTSEDDPGMLRASDEILKRAEDIQAPELTGLAVECNRRHVGFRSENPDRFFRIGGRRLLLRSTSRAIALCKEVLPRREDISKDHPSDEDVEKLLRAVSKLAATVPDGIFRAYGIETARDLTLCVLSWIAGRLNQFDDLHDRLHKQINRAAFRRGLKKVIRTRLAEEIYTFLEATLLPKDKGEAQASTVQAQSSPVDIPAYALPEREGEHHPTGK
jgi:hypothetical protein